MVEISRKPMPRKKPVEPRSKKKAGGWPRTPPGGKPAAHVSRNARRNWKRLDLELRADDAIHIVQALSGG